MTLAILVPVLHRPHRVQPTIESIEATTSGVHRTVFIASPGDTAEHRALLGAGADFFLCDGNYPAKINEGVRRTTEPLIFLAADDLHWQRGWLDAATAKLTENIGVVGVNDLIDRGDREQPTHFLVTRPYTERGTIDEAPGLLHDGYAHNYCDRELVETARHRGVYAYAEDAIVEHLHWINGKAETDPTYEKGQARFREDGRLFRHRSRLWG